jgi:hypothetical protein
MKGLGSDSYIRRLSVIFFSIDGNDSWILGLRKSKVSCDLINDLLDQIQFLAGSKMALFGKKIW